ncbi:hypothetical protein BYT27DRAFT_7291811 [Phlegmacium glaucopus]|nr:hypothetical protein BYT27DRAFT_7291811 [Phlegmacium glaucopus]
MNNNNNNNAGSSKQNKLEEARARIQSKREAEKQAREAEERAREVEEKELMELEAAAGRGGPESGGGKEGGRSGEEKQRGAAAGSKGRGAEEERSGGHRPRRLWSRRRSGRDRNGARTKRVGVIWGSLRVGCKRSRVGDKGKYWNGVWTTGNNSDRVGPE